MMLIRVVWDHPDAIALRDAMVADVAALYSEERAAANRDGSVGVDPESVFATVLIYAGDLPVAALDGPRYEPGGRERHLW